MVNVFGVILGAALMFLSHLHDGELRVIFDSHFFIFLSHLHDGELTGELEVTQIVFLSHLHDGELNEFCYIFGYFNLLKNI